MKGLPPAVILQLSSRRYAGIEVCHKKLADCAACAALAFLCLIVCPGVLLHVCLLPLGLGYWGGGRPNWEIGLDCLKNRQTVLQKCKPEVMHSTKA